MHQYIVRQCLVYMLAALTSSPGSPIFPSKCCPQEATWVWHSVRPVPEVGNAPAGIGRQRGLSSRSVEAGGPWQPEIGDGLSRILYGDDTLLHRPKKTIAD